MMHYAFTAFYDVFLKRCWFVLLISQIVLVHRNLIQDQIKFQLRIARHRQKVCFVHQLQRHFRIPLNM